MKISLKKDFEVEVVHNNINSSEMKLMMENHLKKLSFWHDLTDSDSGVEYDKI